MMFEEAYARAFQDALEHPENYNDIFEGYENDHNKAIALIIWQESQNQNLQHALKIKDKMILDMMAEIETAKSEADNWYQLYHSIKEELKQEKMYHRETENLCDRYCIESQQAKKQLAMEILSDLKKQVHNKATYTHAKDTYSFINLNTFDQIVNEMTRRCENYGNQEA